MVKISNLEVVLLHNNLQLKEGCMKILNHQWPRSESLRNRSLDLSCNELPTSLVLCGSLNGVNQVIGHSRLNTLPNDLCSIWTESVVIHHELRGKGFGKFLMEETEKYANSLGYDYCVLSTHDQQEFYLKLGYQFCSPVSLYGGVVNKNLLPKLNTLFYRPTDSVSKNLCEVNANHLSSNSKTCNNIKPQLANIVPPSPAVAKRQLFKSDIIKMDGTKQFMHKHISKSVD